MFRTALSASALLCALSWAAPGHALPIDFENWDYDGAANWHVSPGGRLVEQSSSSSHPSTFHSPWLAQGHTFTGTVRVMQPDDDFFGFTLGYVPWDDNMNSPLNDFLLIDWKRLTQYNEYSTGPDCYATAGLAVSHVGGALTYDQGGWCHRAAFGVEELERGAENGRHGWELGREYDYVISWDEDSLKVWIDGQKEFDLAGDYANGAFGFYTNQQGGVFFTLDEVFAWDGVSDFDFEAAAASAEAPLPAAAPLLLAGLAWTAALRRRSRRG